jgi:hypothetical protein
MIKKGTKEGEMMTEIEAEIMEVTEDEAKS